MRSISRFPGAYQLQSGYLKIREVTRCELSPVDLRDRSDHAIRRRHHPALPGCVSHDITIRESRRFCQTKDPIAEAVSPTGEAVRQAIGTFIWPDLGDAERDFGNGDRWQGEF